jgi:uncharacterized protein YqgV (UPF0045/DUF77 family)
METVIQGQYDKVMAVVKAMQVTAMENGAGEIVVTLKVHAIKDQDVTWEGKLSKYP